MDHSSSPIPRRKRISDEQLLDAACAEFARAGYEPARMDAIAKTAKTTKATLYARFGTKEELFKATLTRESDLLRERLLHAYSLDPTIQLPERLDAYVDAYFEFGAQRPDGFRLLFMDDGGSAAAVQSTVREEITTRIAALIAAELGQRQPTNGDRVLAALIIGATHYGAGAAAANGIPIAHAATITKHFLLAALSN
jgi:AcrR family transcriptional regulator